MKNLAFVLMAAFLLAVSPSPQPSAQVSPAVQVSPSASPDPLAMTLPVGGADVSIRDLIDLMGGVFLVYTPPKAAHPSSVLVTKPQSEMPSYEPDWHYVSNTPNAFKMPEITIWVSDRLGGKAPFALMESTAVLGLLDAGFGSPSLQKAYATARDADLALGPDAPDPRKNRRVLSAQLTDIINRLMEMLKK